MTKETILIVDDESIVREAIRDWLVDAGYEVTTAETGEKALEILGREQFGLIILDVRLPGKTGIRVLQELRDAGNTSKVIVITAYASPEMRAEATELGASHYLMKPIAPDELEKLVRETLPEPSDAK